MNVRELLARGRERLAAKQQPGLEAEILLGHAIRVERAWLYANGEAEPERAIIQEYSGLVERRVLGEPIAYLTGFREFWSLPLKVNPDVLIPRPETELLVETALEFLPRDLARRVADLGTGSGAVALAIANERPLCEMHVTDHSEAALAVARENAQAILPGRLIFHQGDWLEPLRGRFHLIVCNPPYVAQNDPHLQEGDCRFEPTTALTPGLDALAAIALIARESLRYLEAGGMLAFEHGERQGLECRDLLRSLHFQEIETRRDLAGLDRVTSGKKPP